MIQTPTKPTSSAPDVATEQIVPTNEVPVRRHRWRDPKKVIGISVILFGVLLIGILLGPLHWASGFQGREGSRGILAAPVSAPGFLQAPVYNLVFSSTVSGLISDIYVNLGQHVVANQVLSHLGYNNIPEQVREAQVAVDAARVEVNAGQARLATAITNTHFRVLLAQDTLRAEQNNRRALREQAAANIHFAEVTLQEDEETLDAVMKASEAAIRSARQTESNAIAACQAAASSSTSSPSASDTSSSSDDNASSSNNDNGDSVSSTEASCIKAAQDAFRAAETAANQAVITAQGTVEKDRAALRQAKANADVALTANNGLIVEAADNIDVARTDPEIARAVRDLTIDEFVYRTALATLLVHEKELYLLDLRAPHPGVVTAVIGSVGGQPGALTNFVPAGGIELQSEHGGLTFIQLTDASNVSRVLTYVDEADISKVRVGQKVSFTLKAYGNHQFSGSVILIAPNGVGYPGMQTSIRYPVVIAIDGSSVGSNALFQGMTATVSINT
ncbi:HlyD family secretion protein [Dictyobacter formicarum]|uniref:HlyD family secretion protein n=1 Tax=Dictyobacter formicarum TaxID=2778368 RepID=A0ABQ3VIF5_9CHLR|nr:hypothetical protein [Dictyobacter formicarum]GHO85687.1 hypothetical protein KSZ_36930 [Dictyobacter formicarum]